MISVLWFIAIGEIAIAFVLFIFGVLLMATALDIKASADSLAASVQALATAATAPKPPSTDVVFSVDEANALNDTLANAKVVADNATAAITPAQ